MMRTGAGGELGVRGVASSGRRAAAAEPCDLPVVGREQALTRPVIGARCESVACIDVDCAAENASVGAERAA